MMLKHFDLIREEIVAWVNVSATAFLAHFAIWNSSLENCLTFCMISRYSLRFCFLIILLFLSHAWMYFVQSSTIRQLLLIRHTLLTIFIHFFVHSALIISCDLAQRVKILTIFFSAFSSCFVYSFMRWRFVFWFDSDFDICSLKVLMNFSSFIVFQLRRDLRADSSQALRSITVCIDRWSEKFFISSLISHRINLFVMFSVVTMIDSRGNNIEIIERNTNSRINKMPGLWDETLYDRLSFKHRLSLVEGRFRPQGFW